MDGAGIQSFPLTASRVAHDPNDTFRVCICNRRSYRTAPKPSLQWIDFLGVGIYLLITMGIIPVR